MTNRPDQWVTVQEASEIIGRSENAVRLLVKRGKFDQLRKVRNKGRGYWVIHRDSIDKLVNSDQLVIETNQSDRSYQTNQDHFIPLNHYEEQRKLWLEERDQLTQGLMMYRYKFEELDKQIRMLPAPPETITKELEFKTTALDQAHEILKHAQDTQKYYDEAMAQLILNLQEEEHAKEAFKIQWELAQAALKRPWWKKLFGMK